MARDSELQQFGVQIDALIQRVEQTANPSLREDVQALIGSLMALHRKGLDAILGAISKQKVSGSLLENMVAEPFVEGLLLLHDLHPHDAETRVRRVLERISRDLRIETRFLELEEGVARIRLISSGCHSAADGVSKAVEAAVFDAAPEVAQVDIQTGDAEASPGPLIQLAAGISAIRP
jgi:hypothetical protein